MYFWAFMYFWSGVLACGLAARAALIGRAWRLIALLAGGRSGVTPGHISREAERAGLNELAASPREGRPLIRGGWRRGRGLPVKAGGDIARE